MYVVLYVLPCFWSITCLVYMVLCVYHAPERSHVWCTGFCTYYHASDRSHVWYTWFCVYTMLPVDHMSGVHGSVRIAMLKIVPCRLVYVLPCFWSITCLVYIVLCVYHAPERSHVWCAWFCTYYHAPDWSHVWCTWFCVYTMLPVDHMSGVHGSVCISCSRSITCLVYMVLCVYHAPERSFVWCTWFCTYCAMLPIDHMCDVHGSVRITMLLIDHMSGVHCSVVLPCSWSIICLVYMVLYILPCSRSITCLVYMVLYVLPYMVLKVLPCGWLGSKPQLTNWVLPCSRSITCLVYIVPYHPTPAHPSRLVHMVLSYVPGRPTSSGVHGSVM